MIYAASHRKEEACAECEVALANAPDEQNVLGLCGTVYGLVGRRQEALSFRDRLTSLSARHYVDPYILAGVCDALGDGDCAMEYLERAYAERSSNLCNLQVDLWTDRLRADPRFQELVRRMNFPPRPSS